MTHHLVLADRARVRRLAEHHTACKVRVDLAFAVAEAVHRTNGFR